MNQRKWLFIFVVIALVALAGGVRFYKRIKTIEPEPIATIAPNEQKLETHPALENSK